MAPKAAETTLFMVSFGGRKRDAASDIAGFTQTAGLLLALRLLSCCGALCVCHNAISCDHPDTHVLIRLIRTNGEKSGNINPQSAA
jgi:hypothetical protein